MSKESKKGHVTCDNREQFMCCKCWYHEGCDYKVAKRDEYLKGKKLQPNSLWEYIKSKLYG